MINNNNVIVQSMKGNKMKGEFGIKSILEESERLGKTYSEFLSKKLAQLSNIYLKWKLNYLTSFLILKLENLSRGLNVSPEIFFSSDNSDKAKK